VLASVSDEYSENPICENTPAEVHKENKIKNNFIQNKLNEKRG
jgi:hypothetical protein